MFIFDVSCKFKFGLVSIPPDRLNTEAPKKAAPIKLPALILNLASNGGNGRPIVPPRILTVSLSTCALFPTDPPYKFKVAFAGIKNNDPEPTEPPNTLSNLPNVK